MEATYVITYNESAGSLILKVGVKVLCPFNTNGPISPAQKISREGTLSSIPTSDVRTDNRHSQANSMQSSFPASRGIDTRVCSKRAARSSGLWARFWNRMRRALSKEHAGVDW